MNNPKVSSKSGVHPLAWVPSLYFAEGIPYIVIVVMSVIMYKRMGIDNSDIAFYTSWLYFPWVIKPFWSPFVEVISTKRFWIVAMQLLLGAGFAGVALMLPTDNFFQYTLAFFWLLAFSSATHDIAADGFYMLGLRQDQQTFYVGFRSTFYRIAMITGQGLLVILAGYLEDSINIVTAWQVVMGILAVIMIAAGIYHRFILPREEPVQTSSPEEQLIAETGDSKNSGKSVWAESIHVLAEFFNKKQVGLMLAFLLLYRLGEAQLVKMTSPFMLDSREVGGLALATEQVGFLYGTIGVISLVLGGILGGIVASVKGLKYWIWWMAIAINLPNLAYVLLAHFQPENLFLIGTSVAVEQFGYGFGFTAYMLYLIYIADGPYKTAHYAFGTGIMAAGMMIPGMASGWIQETVGYESFFIWVVIATIPGFLIIKFLDIDPEFGKKHE